MVAYVQGVFINPALVEPFGLTLIEVGFYLVLFLLCDLDFLGRCTYLDQFIVSNYAGIGTWASNGGYKKWWTS